jgi:hypothetical protein
MSLGLMVQQACTQMRDPEINVLCSDLAIATESLERELSNLRVQLAPVLAPMPPVQELAPFPPSLTQFGQCLANVLAGVRRATEAAREMQEAAEIR